MPYTVVATITATTSVISEAHCAFIFTTPSSTKIVSSGRTAKIVDSPSECPMGSKIWWYMTSCHVPPDLRPHRTLAGTVHDLRRSPAAHDLRAAGRGEDEGAVGFADHTRGGSDRRHHGVRHADQSGCEQRK